MKIAIVCDRAYPFFKGGVEKRYWELAQKLIEKGHEIHIFTGQWPEMTEKDMLIDGIYLHGVYKVQNFYVNGKKSIKESIIFAIKVFPALMKADFDVIDCDQFPLLHIFSVKLVSILKRKRIVLTWSEAWGSYWIKYIGLKGIIGMVVELIVTKLPHEIISVSEHTTEGLIKKTKTSKDRIVTIPIGIDLEMVNKTEISKESSDIIFVGRLFDHKNVSTLIDAVKEIKTNNNKDVKCLIIGNGPEQENLVAKVKELKLEYNIKFLKYIYTKEEVYSLMKSSKVFVLPSTREGFGITIIEANACGLPVVTIEHSDNAASMHIKNNRNGILSDLEVGALAINIKEIIANSENFKNNCISYASNFDLDSIVSKVLFSYFPYRNS